MRPPSIARSAEYLIRPDPSMIEPFFRTRSGAFMDLSLCAVQCGDRPVHFRPPVAIKLPVSSHLADFIQVEVGDYQLILFFAAFRKNAPVGIAEIRRAEE